MRNLVLNIAAPNHVQIGLTPDRARQLTELGILETSMAFLSKPDCPVNEPRLRCASQGWHDVIQALLARRREDRARAQTVTFRTDAQHLADRAMLILHGKPDHVERFDAGFLSQVEICNVARQVLFEKLDLLPRWRRLRHADVPHGAGCLALEPIPAPSFRVTVATELAPSEAESLARVKAAADVVANLEVVTIPPTSVTIEIRCHDGICPRCRFGRISALSAQVVVAWNGWTLVREYAL